MRRKSSAKPVLWKKICLGLLLAILDRDNSVNKYENLDLPFNWTLSYNNNKVSRFANIGWAVYRV